MLEDLQVRFHSFSFGKSLLGEVLVDLVAMTLKYQGVLVPGCFHKLFLGVEVVQFYNDVPGGPSSLRGGGSDL